MTYLNITEVETGLAGLAKAYPAITKLITLPNTTHEGRTSHALRMGTKSSVAKKDGVLVIGGVHAREWGSCEICLNFAADLLGAYTKGTGLVYGGKSFPAKKINTLLKDRHVYVFPLVNPDGRHYSQNVDNLWRKNRHPGMTGTACIAGAAADSSPSDNFPGTCTAGMDAGGACAGGVAADFHPLCDGVDINRNYDFLWNFPVLFDLSSNVDLYTSNDPCNNTYHGPAACSEPETKNVRWLLDTYPKIKYFVDLHCYCEKILHVWGDDENQTTDPDMNFMNSTYNGARGVDGDAAYKEYIPAEDLKIVKRLTKRMQNAIKAVRGKNYLIEQSFDLYPTSGTSDDYVYSRHFVDPGKNNIHAFTIEWGTTFQPPWKEMKNIILDISAGLIEFCIATI